ncbi:diaminopimelate epimerase, partial [Buchnera aphidicola]|nr:diaminopimelate epimerase [Buchnera aphidicola]
IGSYLMKNIVFPDGINVNFMEIINKECIKLRVYERDIGETQSCGSGACAAVSAGVMQNLLSKKVQVKLLGGDLTIKWQGLGYPLY